MALIKDKILVIEDEKSISYLLGTVLTANGYDVIKAYTGTEACEMLDAYCPDLILLDLGLPDMDGVDIIRRVRSRGTAPIVVVSARTRERDKIEALDLGADDYITKPFGGGELLARSVPRCGTPGTRWRGPAIPRLEYTVLESCASTLTGIWCSWKGRMST